MTEESNQPTEGLGQQSNAAPASSVQSEAAGPGNELRTFLDEYERAAEPRPSPENFQPAPQPFDDDSRATLSQLKDWAGRMEAERRHTLDHGDFERVVKSANDRIKDLGLPDDYARGWLTNAANTDPDLRRAWDNRYSSPEALANAQRTVERTLSRLFKQSTAHVRRGVLDHEATADRNAVAAAVRGARTEVPATPAPNLGRMSNAEFNQYLRDLGIRNAV